MAVEPAILGEIDIEHTNLESVVVITRRALGCDAVLISRWGPNGRPTIAASAGISPEQLEEIWPVLYCTAREQIAVAEESGAYGVGRSAGDLDDIAYAMHHCAPLHCEGRYLGALHVLLCDSGHRIDVGLLEAFAAHSAVALAHIGLREHAARMAERRYHCEAFDRLPLSADTMTELIPRIDDALELALGPVSTGVMVLDEDRSTLQLVAGSFGAPEPATSSYRVRIGDLHSNGARVFGLQRPYMSNRAKGDPGMLQDYVQMFGIDRVMSVPLKVGDELTGVLHIANRHDDFAISDLQRCVQLVSRVAVAVESTRMLMQLRTQHQLEKVLSDIAVAIASNEAGEQFLPEGFERLRAVTDASVIALVPAESEPTLTADDAVPRQVLRRLVDGARKVHGERSQVSMPRHAGDPGSAVFHFPVTLGSRSLGTLSVLRSRGEAFTVQERRGLARMGGLIALAWASEHYQQQRASLARVEERQRIADDLHDDVGQLLFAAQMHLDLVLEAPNTDAALASSLTLIRALLTRADSTIRTEIAQLTRPPTDDGLVERLSEIVDGIEQEFGLLVHLDISGEPAATGDSSCAVVNETLFRVARESLVNAAKHAGPCRISLHLDCRSSRWVRLRVVDDGLGLSDSSNEAHHGMASLKRSARKHGGSLQVRRNPGGGTTVAVKLPI
jgi:signal transduction histidine kinase